MSDVTFINTIEGLQQLRYELAEENLIAIDTEFHSENRYFPELMLLQIANRKGKVWIVDPKAVSVRPLGAAMRNLTIVTHGGQMDVGILDRELELKPHRLFDTQIAAGFLGYRYPMGLDQLLQKTLNRSMSKGETLTDWSVRPLSTEQLEYAAEDSRALIPLYEHLLTQIQNASPKKELWCWQACEEMVKSQLEIKNIGLSWLHWGLAETLDLASQRVLTNLLEWRESTAEKKDQSPNYLLPRGILLYLAKTKPTDVSKITNRKVHPIFLKKYGKKVIQVIKQGLQDSDTFEIPTSEQRELEDILSTWIALYAKEIEIAPQLLVNKDILYSIILQGTEFLQGWRKEILQQRLQNFLDGCEGVGICNGAPILLPLHKL